MPGKDSAPAPQNASVSLTRAAEAHIVVYSRKALFLILVLAFALRLGWALHSAHAVENEGAEYARIAQNLLHQHRYNGILGGPESIFPPLYPCLIAVGSFLTGDTEIAGRAISVVMGSLLVVPVLFMGRRLFGLRTGYLAGALIALQPLLVALSASVYVESTYLTLLFGGLYFGIRALDFDHLRHAFLCGLLLGLAYLARPEGLAYAVLVGVFIALALAFRETPTETALKYACTLAVATMILVIPYATYLTARGGTLRLEGKSALNEIINQRMNRGMDYLEAGYGLGPHLEPEGPYLTADQFALKVPSMSHELATMARSYFHGIVGRTAHVVIGVAMERAFGSTLICLLALVGIFRPGWADRKWFGEGLLLGAAGLTLIILLSLRFVWGRYLFPFLPFLVLCAAVGIDFISRRIVQCLRGTKLARVATVTPLVLTATLLLWAMPGVPRDRELAESSEKYLKEAGRWLDRYKPGSKSLMAVGSTLPYYANGTQLYLPYTDSTRALAYIHGKRPDFIVLQGDELNTRPYMRDWFQHSIPDACAQPIRHTDGTELQEIEIYQWNCSK